MLAARWSLVADAAAQAATTHAAIEVSSTMVAGSAATTLSDPAVRAFPLAAVRRSCGHVELPLSSDPRVDAHNADERASLASGH